MMKDRLIMIEMMKDSLIMMEMMRDRFMMEMMKDRLVTRRPARSSSEDLGGFVLELLISVVRLRRSSSGSVLGFVRVSIVR